MPCDPHIHNRRSIRLKGYDYTWPGAYFATIVVQDRDRVLSTIRDGHVELTDLGLYVRQRWDDLPNHYSHIKLDAFVIMPNHVHGIVLFSDDHREFDVVGMGWRMFLNGERMASKSTTHAVGVGLRPTPTRPAPTESPPTHTSTPKIIIPPKRHPFTEIVRAFKSFSGRDINTHRGTEQNRFWQRDYYEHIIRDKEELHTIREYIMNNPRRWEYDSLYDA